MAVKKNLGKVIGQVNGFRIRQSNQTTVNRGKEVTKSTQIGLYAGKKLVQSGFKNLETAMATAKEISQKSLIKSQKNI